MNITILQYIVKDLPAIVRRSIPTPQKGRQIQKHFNGVGRQAADGIEFELEYEKELGIDLFLQDLLNS